MKKRIVSLLCAFALILGIMPMTVFAEGEPVYLALGDSITTGYRLGEGEQSFAQQVATAKGFTLDNQAKDGETSTTLKQKIAEGTIDVSKADLITITIGGNDLMNALYAYLADKSGKSVDEIKTMLTSNTADIESLKSMVTYLDGFAKSDQASQALSTFTTNLSSIVNAIKTENPNATILVATQYNPYSYLAATYGSWVEEAQTISDAFDAGVQALNGVISSAAFSKSFTVVDVYSAFKTAVSTGTNPCNASVNIITQSVDLDFHPNATGHRLIADTINGVLKMVTGVTITPEEPTVEKGKTQEFTATVSGIGSYDNTVTWSVSGNNSNNTSINDTGLLTVSADETATTLTVRATAKGDSSKYAETTVTITGGREPIEINKTNFPDDAFRQYVSDKIDTSNKDGFKDRFLSEEEINACTYIDVSNLGIRDLTGIQYFTKLTYLDCSENQLTELNVSGNAALTELYCNNNQLTKLDVSENKELVSLNCSFNQLTKLDVSTNTALETLDCYSNRLTTLDVSNNKALETLDCNNNQLTKLDVSVNKALVYLYCYSNRLTTLDVSNNTALEAMSCYGNQLTELNVSNNIALKTLSCGDNPLTELDVSENTVLTNLYCYSNRLTTLDVSNNTALKELYCDNNQLTKLDVSKNVALETLSCDNQAFTVDVTSTTDQKWSFDLSTLFSKEEWSKVSNVSVQNATLAADGKTVSWVNGAKAPVVQYSYNTADDPNSTKTMAVTLTLNYTPYEEDAEYTITFNGNGGYVSESSVTTTGGKLTSMPVAVRYGYTFTGWYTGDGYLVTLNTVFNHNTTLYAGWQVNEIYRPVEPTRPVEPEPDEPEIEWVREDGNTQLYIDGRMVTGWYQDEDDSWYFFDEDSGIMMQNDWAEVDNVWYYFERDGVMQTGWIEYDDNWYYLKDWGGMATGWQYIDHVWYYFKDWGGMATGWQYINGNWYYFRGSGAMVASAWVETNGKWYYLTGSGAMAADRWIEWKGEWYYLYSSGAMATNATIDGYYVNASGAWVQ